MLTLALVCLISVVFLQVLLFLQKEKEESSPEAQVKEADGDDLKHCGHCRVLNGSNYTKPSASIPPPRSSFLRPPHLPRPPRSPRPLPSWRNVAVLLTPRETFLIHLQTNYKRTCITTGSLRKRVKAVTVKLDHIKKNDAVRSSCCILDSMQKVGSAVGSGENRSGGSSERNLLRKNDICFLFLFFFWCVFWDQGKRWTMLMFNLRGTGSISPLKQIFMYFIFPFLFCKLILNCQTRILHSALFFPMLFLSSVLPSPVFFSSFVAQSLASGTVEEWAMADIKLSLFLLHFWERKRLQWEKL